MSGRAPASWAEIVTAKQAIDGVRVALATAAEAGYGGFVTQAASAAAVSKQLEGLLIVEFLRGCTAHDGVPQR